MTRDIVWFLGPHRGADGHDWELRHSLRSARRYCRFPFTPWILGRRPSWAGPELRCIPCGDPLANNKDGNLMRKLFVAAAHEAVGEEFLTASDDHYWMQPMDWEDHRYWYGEKKIYDEPQPGDHKWHRALKATGALLRSHGLPSKNWDCHIPYRIQKDWLRELPPWMDWAGQALTVYSALLNTRSERELRPRPIGSERVRCWPKAGQTDIHERLLSNKFLVLDNAHGGPAWDWLRRIIANQFWEPAPWEALEP